MTHVWNASKYWYMCCVEQGVSWMMHLELLLAAAVAQHPAACMTLYSVGCSVPLQSSKAQLLMCMLSTSGDLSSVPAEASSTPCRLRASLLST